MSSGPFWSSDEFVELLEQVQLAQEAAADAVGAYRANRAAIETGLEQLNGQPLLEDVQSALRPLEAIPPEVFIGAGAVAATAFQPAFTGLNATLSTELPEVAAAAQAARLQLAPVAVDLALDLQPVLAAIDMQDVQIAFDAILEAQAQVDAMHQLGAVGIPYTVSAVGSDAAPIVEHLVDTTLWYTHNPTDLAHQATMLYSMAYAVGLRIWEHEIARQLALMLMSIFVAVGTMNPEAGQWEVIGRASVYRWLVEPLVRLMTADS